ncbi:MAG TPA: hypothetical protein VHO70_06220 [Chitinispirillaceae bacterium]|nr:hypothetical protein [Chitinispirillaceae bacterium]
MSIDALNAGNSVFSPTNEAKAYNWESLFPGTQNALSKIFHWIDAACTANQQSKISEQEKLASHYESPSTSILLAGDRGSGKTTVLLSAAYAFKLATEDFFGKSGGNGVNELKDILNNNRHKVFWLDALDLEPLHPNTNLLATLLVRIRLAIEKMDDQYRDYRSVRHSILEGDLETGEALDRLITDATFMWEALAGSSGPGVARAEDQINAAEKSAKFQSDFKEVMEKTTSLVKNIGLQQTEIFLLPIDNVDRSIEHIANISKLIRLATSKRLWFILAAVRPEYQLFLERSFQKELLRSRTSNDTSSWDQTQAIARRQAATAMRRSIPENYQICIEPLSPFQAWTFSNHNTDEIRNIAGKDVELRDLLDDDIFSSKDTKEKTRFQKFASLFNITSQLDNITRNNYLEATDYLRVGNNCDDLKEIFSGAGKMALGLSMRTLQDLKAAIALYQGNKEWAVEVSVRMLRNAIDESNLPFWASRELQDHIIRKDSNDKWVLDLSNNPIGPFKQQKQFSELSYPVYTNKNVDFIIEEKLQYQEFPDVVLELQDTAHRNNRIPLQPAVAGWLMILHDILVLSENKRVFSEQSLPETIFSSAVQNSHKLIYKKKRNVELLFVWKTPEWPTFTEHFICAVQWTAILNKLKDTFRESTKKLFKEIDCLCGKDKEENRRIEMIENAKEANRLLHMAWIDNICSVSVENIDDWKWRTLKTLTNDVTGKEYAEEIKLKLSKLISWSRADKFDTRKHVAWQWLSRELPLLLGPEYSMLVHQEGESKYIVPEILTQIMEKTWDGEQDPKQPKEYWSDINDYWRDNCGRLMASREEIVRLAIKRCAAFEQCTNPEDFITFTIKDWFSTISSKFYDDIPLVKEWDTWSSTFGQKGI